MSFALGARQSSTHDRISQGKGTLLCTFQSHAWQTRFAVHQAPRTAEKHLTARPFETVVAGFAMRLAWRRTTKGEVFAV
jgi:hypothetical protein